MHGFPFNDTPIDRFANISNLPFILVFFLLRVVLDKIKCQHLCPLVSAFSLNANTEQLIVISQDTIQILNNALKKKI